MPEAFTECIKSGGKVVTKTLSNGRYMHMCKTKAGKWTAGEVKSKDGKGKNRRWSDKLK